MACSLGELATAIGADLRGDPEAVVDRVATLQGAGPESVSFLANRRYRRFLEGTRAGAVILQPEDALACPTAALVMGNPYLGYARAARRLNPPLSFAGGVHPSASVSERAWLAASAWVGPKAVVEAEVKLEEGVFIGPGCVVGEGAHLGPGTRLVANVTVCAGVRLGARVLVHPGAVLGADGFGLANDRGVWVKIPQLGSLVVGDDVEVGANTTIDRGALEDTLIEEGVKLDNQIQIGHNCVIGAHTAIAGSTGIAGSTRIGRRCMIGGGVGINGHIAICDDVQVSGRSVVYQPITEPGMYASGTPLAKQALWLRNAPRFHQLDEMMKRIRRLEQRED
jgi:UDP-3-O-[3-hydroxymyristoyl] glucosamine N-acyltransferase